MSKINKNKNKNINNTNSSDESISQYGGQNNKILSDVPTGSCPPIFYCDKKNVDIVKEDTNRNKGFSKDSYKTALSIKDIMTERREDKKPFIML
jgi:hypothetical protein